MIVKRNRQKPAGVRKIVRRTPTVGVQTPRRIVTRSRGVSVVPPRRSFWRARRLGMPHRRRISIHVAKRYVVLAAALGSLALVGGWSYWVFTSPFFRVSDVVVEGNSRVSTDTIVGAANVFGDSMFTTDLAAAQKELYQLPLVNSVRVEREWPHTLKILVEERKA
ncbi:MAG: FtsQ-type POTRA domain-containing protein, partial [Tepidiformaceae bacterium]